jgi:hypothetical protein
MHSSHPSPTVGRPVGVHQAAGLRTGCWSKSAASWGIAAIPCLAAARIATSRADYSLVLLRHKLTPPSFRGARRASPESITTDVCEECNPRDHDLVPQLPPVVMDSGLIRVPRMPRNDGSQMFLRQ